MEIQVITNRCFGLFMRRNVSISRNRTKIERLLDWKEFPSKSVGRFSFQCLTGNITAMYQTDTPMKAPGGVDFTKYAPLAILKTSYS